MAIVQISRIQHRRGKADSGTGLPQLASGELGWAIDRQKLYIGNGSVSEGAPFVGNTEILTAGTDIFALADQYKYKPLNSLWNGEVPFARDLQSKLDDVVSVFDFGATGDGTDQTAAIQSAIDKLYKSTEVSNRVVLWFPAGEYTISSTLQVPPYATLRGAGKNKTILNANNCDLFQTIHYDPNDPDVLIINQASQAQYIEISEMTLTSNSKNTVLSAQSCKFSVFKDLRFEGTWASGDAEETWFESKAICLDSFSNDVISRNNIFSNIEVDGFFYAVYSDYDIMYNTFSNMNLITVGRGVAFGEGTTLGSGAQQYGPRYNTVEESIFDRIDTQGINIAAGEYNVSKSNQFLNVGNFGNPAVTSDSTAIITFASHTNTSTLDFFERLNTTSNLVSLGVVYPAEVEGRKFLEVANLNEVSIGPGTGLTLLHFPIVERGTIFIDYVYTESANDSVKEGTIEIISNIATEEITVTDVFNFVGNQSFVDDLTFTAIYEDNNSDLSPDTITMLATNTIPGVNVNNDNFLYRIRVKSN